MTAECIVGLMLEKGGREPQYQTQGSAGLDIAARLERPLKIDPLERLSVPTGIYIALPEGCEAQIRPRSGLSIKKGITCINSPGTIDSDYRGEIRVLLVNLGKEAAWIRDGDRIAQLVISKVVKAKFQRIEAIPPTERGTGGFGSTGL